ncbi:MAG: hypothetical protein GX130_13900 [Candidatus Hydrogenedens sp.]|jgi:6-phosphogluconolactonase|nr:hypothetical protein [Candidatus Hydrogenedens sp.]
MMLISVFDTRCALFQAAYNRIVQTSRACDNLPSALLIPGGGTPRPLFEMVAETPIDLCPHAHLGFTDERHVPLDDEDSNYGLARPMIEALQLSQEQVIRVPVEKTLQEAAQGYDAQWKGFFDQGGVIRLAFLGIGDDGHTCSLFSREDLAADGGEKYAIAVNRPSGPQRISVTPTLLARVAHVVFLIAGSGKADIVKAMQERREEVVAAQAVAKCSHVSLWYCPED